MPYASRAVDVLASVAIHHFHIDIDDVTCRCWHDVMALMREADNHTDASHESQRIIRLLSVLETFDTRFESLAPQAIGIDRYATLIKLAAGIIRNGEEMRLAQTGSEYSSLRREEAIKTAAVIALLVSNDVTMSQDFESFTQTIKQMAIGAGYIDTARDARRDYHDGVLAFEPTRDFRLGLLRQGFQELRPVLPAMLHIPVIAQMGKLSYRAFRSHRQNMRARRRSRM